MNIIYWSVRSSSRRGGDGVNRVNVGYCYLARCKHHFITLHANPINDISINFECWTYRRPVIKSKNLFILSIDGEDIGLFIKLVPNVVLISISLD